MASIKQFLKPRVKPREKRPFLVWIICTLTMMVLSATIGYTFLVKIIERQTESVIQLLISDASDAFLFDSTAPFTNHATMLLNAEDAIISKVILRDASGRKIWSSDNDGHSNEENLITYGIMDHDGKAVKHTKPFPDGEFIGYLQVESVGVFSDKLMQQFLGFSLVSALLGAAGAFYCIFLMASAINLPINTIINHLRAIGDTDNLEVPKIESSSKPIALLAESLNTYINSALGKTRYELAEQERENDRLKQIIQRHEQESLNVTDAAEITMTATSENMPKIHQALSRISNIIELLNVNTKNDENVEEVYEIVSKEASKVQNFVDELSSAVAPANLLNTSPHPVPVKQLTGRFNAIVEDFQEVGIDLKANITCPDQLLEEDIIVNDGVLFRLIHHIISRHDFTGDPEAAHELDLTITGSETKSIQFKFVCNNGIGLERDVAIAINDLLSSKTTLNKDVPGAPEKIEEGTMKDIRFFQLIRQASDCQVDFVGQKNIGWTLYVTFMEKTAQSDEVPQTTSLRVVCPDVKNASGLICDSLDLCEPNYLSVLNGAHYLIVELDQGINTNNEFLASIVAHAPSNSKLIAWFPDGSITPSYQQRAWLIERGFFTYLSGSIDRDKILETISKQETGPFLPLQPLTVDISGSGLAQNTAELIHLFDPNKNK